MQKISGTVEQILITATNNDISNPIKKGNFTFEGLVGDRHYGYTMLSNSRQPEYPRGTEIRNHRQITILSTEELEETAAQLNIPEIQAAWLAGNILISGIPSLTNLPTTTRLFFSSGVVLVTGGENLPCSIPARNVQSMYPNQPDIASGFIKAARNHRGLVAWVEHPGIIEIGDTCSTEIPASLITLWSGK
jgi:hypothetical protein